MTYVIKISKVYFRVEENMAIQEMWQLEPLNVLRLKNDGSDESNWIEVFYNVRGPHRGRNVLVWVSLILNVSKMSPKPL